MRHHVDGVQTEYVHIPHTGTSFYKLSPGADEEALVMLSGIFPTGLECDVLNGRAQPGNSVAIVGAGPIGLASLPTTQSCSPAQIITIDTNAARLEVAGRPDATACIDVPREDAAAAAKRLMDSVGVDCATEAVGAPATFELCQQLITPDGMATNISIYGVRADLYLETLWSQSIAITTGSVDTVGTPTLLKTAHAGKLLPGQLITHRLRLGDILAARDTFRNAIRTQALKVIISA